MKKGKKDSTPLISLKKKFIITIEPKTHNCKGNYVTQKDKNS